MLRQGAIALAVVTMTSVMPAACAADIDTPGLLINETRTFAGRAFFDAFATIWQAYDPNSRYTLVVLERPSARNGSQVTVSYLGNPVFQRFIGFNARAAERAGRDASATTFNAVTAIELDRQIIDPDLGRDELLQ